MTSRLVLWLALGLNVALSGCGVVGKLTPKQQTPTRLGPHAVGVTTLEIEDFDRDRAFDVEVWYPAAARAASPVVYEIDVASITMARIRSVSGAGRDVAPLRAGPFPVVLLSHGYASTRFSSVGLAEMLASNGYIVAAPDHAGTTMNDLVTGIDALERQRSAYDRPIDLSRVLDDLVARSQRDDDRFAGLVDVERVAVAGHSFGGRTALAMTGAVFDVERQRAECRANGDDRRCNALAVFGRGRYRYRDPRVKAALLITPAGYRFYRDDGVAKVEAPTLIVGAREDITNPYDEFHGPVFNALTSPRYLLDLEKAGHLTATDCCELIDSIGFFAKKFGGARSRDGCGGDFISGADALDRVGQAALEFFALHLDGDAAAHDRLLAALERPVGPRGTTSSAVADTRGGTTTR